MKRRGAELYLEEACVLYLGTILALPVAQWLMHRYVYAALFGSTGTYRYVELLCMAAWMGVLVFNFLTDLPGYDRHPNCRHWSCRLRRFFVNAFPSQPDY